jgi:hypothetical protein
MNLYSKLHGSANVAESALDAKSVLITDKNESGYFKPEEFLDFLKSLRKEDCEHIENLFKSIGEGLRMTNSLNLRRDKLGNAYYWAKFARANADEGIKVPAYEGLVGLLSDYRVGKVKINFTLDELVNEILS